MKYLFIIPAIFLFLLFSNVQQIQAKTQNYNLSMVFNTTDVSINDPECGFNPRICVLNINGFAQGLPLGKVKYSSTLSSFWDRATPNGRDGFCAPTGGEMEMSNISGKINAHFQGNVCDITFQSERLPHLYDLRYDITSGTGKYAEAAGTGTIKGWDTKSRIVFNIRGNIRY